MTAKNEATKTSMLDESIEPTPGPAGAETMKAIVQTEYGSSPERVLRLAEIDRPVISDHEVLVRVRAASVDRGTWHLMTGLPKLMPRGVEQTRRQPLHGPVALPGPVPDAPFGPAGPLRACPLIGSRRRSLTSSHVISENRSSIASCMSRRPSSS